MLRTLAATPMIVVMALGSALAGPSQKVVSFDVDGQKVVGTLEIPEATEKPPVILLLHGFMGNRDGFQIPAVKEGMFARAANAWAAQGIASLRIDFRGCGESSGSFEDTTISGEIKDAMAAVDFLQSEESVDAGRLAVVGWSQGGAVAASLAGRTTHRIRAVALWSPLVMPEATTPAVFGSDVVKAGLASAGRAIKFKLPWGPDVSLKTAFFEDTFAIDPVAELANYPGPVFVAVGTNDTVVTPQPAFGQLLLTYHKGPGELWVRPMDHAINGFTNVDTVDELIAATGTFVARNVK